VAKYDFMREVVKKNGENLHVVVGMTSVGKSSLLNWALGLKLEVDLGEQTK
jgi:hypothetical protein